MPRVLFLLMIVSPLVCGCSGESGTALDSREKAEGRKTEATPSGTAKYETPDASYAALVSATKDNDWKAAATLLTPESQAMMTAGMIMGASFMTMGDEGKQEELTELFARHGINLDEDQGEPSEDASPEEMMMAMTRPIKDIPTFLGELTAWMDKAGDEEGGGFAELGNSAN